MMIVVAAAALICSTIIGFLLMHRHKHAGVLISTSFWKKNKNPPGPSGLPVVGNLLEFDKIKPHIYLLELSRKYGPLAYLRLGSTPTLVVSSAKLAKQILKTDDLSFCTRPPVLGQQRLSYNGADMAFSPYNSHWKEIRRMCVHNLFSPKQIVSFRPIREGQVGRMMERISALAGSAKPADLSDMAMSLASNIICGLAFGRTYDKGDYEKKRLDRLVLEAQALMVGFYFSDHFFPPALFGWVDKASGLLGRLDKNFRELDSFYQQLIDDHLHTSTVARDGDRDGEEDIIDLMINLKRSSPESITWDHMKALLMNLFVAGTDTVAAAVVWTMTALMLRPTIMKKLQEEIRQAIGCRSRSNEGFMMINEDDINNGKLPYLKAVVMEALRLYPPAPLLYRTRVAEHGDHGEEAHVVGGYKIEAGATFIINGWAIGRDPETWVDADEFLPERFMSRKEEEEHSLEFEMIPFGGGRRGCPGMGMGLVSIHLALANLLYSFDWALPPTAPAIDTDALPGLTMHKKNPLLLLATNHYPPSSI